MPKWIKFSAAYDHRPIFSQVSTYPAGAVLWVKNDIADAAIAAGAGVETDKPEGDIEDDDGEPSNNRRNTEVASLHGADAHWGMVRIELHDADSSQRE